MQQTQIASTITWSWVVERHQPLSTTRLCLGLRYSSPSDLSFTDSSHVKFGLPWPLLTLSAHQALLLYLGLGPAMLRRLEKVFQSTQAVLNLQLVQKSKDMATCGSIKNGSGLLLKCFQGLNTTLRLLYEIYILLFFPANRNALGSLHIQNHPLYNDHKIATSLVSAPLS